MQRAEDYVDQQSLVTTLEHNLEQHVPGGSDFVRVFARPSTELSPEEIGTSHRLFHIDGGHNCDEAFSDLELAAQSTLPEGVILVDDPFYGSYPGVSEAINKFLATHGEYCGLAVGFNKLAIIKKEASSFYENALDRKNLRAEYDLDTVHTYKKLPFHGHPLRIFHLNSRFRGPSLRNVLRRHYKENGWSQNPFMQLLSSLGKQIIPK